LGRHGFWKFEPVNPKTLILRHDRIKVEGCGNLAGFDTGLAHTRGANLPRALALPSELRDLEARGEGLAEWRRSAEFIFFLFRDPLPLLGLRLRL